MDGGRFLMVTHPDERRARDMARDLVERRLVACVQVLPGIRSFYRWRGAIEEDDEILMFMKTWEDRLEELRRRIVALHPYEVPQIVSLPLIWGHAPYLDWLREQTREAPAGAGSGGE